MYWLNNKAITRYIFSLFFNAADFAGKSVVFCKVLKNFWYYFPSYLFSRYSFPSVLVNLPRDWRVWNYFVSNILLNLSLKDISIFTLTMHTTPLDDSKWHWSPRIFFFGSCKTKNWFLCNVVHLFDMASGQFKLEMALSVE